MVEVEREGGCGEGCVGRDWQRVRDSLIPDSLLFDRIVAGRLSVQQVMQDIERAQLKGDEDELKALEIDVTGKILLASWRGTRFEVVQVLREVRVFILISFASLYAYGLTQCVPTAYRS